MVKEGNNKLLLILLVVAVVFLSNNGFFTGKAVRTNLAYIEPQAVGTPGKAPNILESIQRRQYIPAGPIVSSPTSEGGTQYVTDGCDCDLSKLNQMHFLFKKEDHCTIQSNACEGYCKIWAAVPDKHGYVTSKSHIYTKNVPCINTISVASSGLNY
ncbi:MAG: hypothetical protein AABY07_08280 [Nanoarchaeota archaeon]